MDVTFFRHDSHFCVSSYFHLQYFPLFSQMVQFSQKLITLDVCPYATFGSIIVGSSLINHVFLRFQIFGNRGGGLNQQPLGKPCQRFIRASRDPSGESVLRQYSRGSKFDIKV